MDNEPLWIYEGNEDAISVWLGRLASRFSKFHGLAARHANRDMALGEASPGSGWTRDKELSEWIDASQTSWDAWEGVRRLLSPASHASSPLET